MRAIVCKGHGEAAVLQLASVESPAIAAGQVRLKVHAFGINRADTLQRRGLYPPPPGASEILGLEVAGEVVEVGAGATMHGRGDRVMALLPGGGYAEEVCVDQGLVLPLPKSWTWAQGAATPEVFVTAHLNLFTLGRIESGRVALVHAGASGVGTAAIQLLRAAGKDVFVTVGSAAKVKACEDLGACAVDYNRQNFVEIVKAGTHDGGVDVVLDPIGAAYLAGNLDVLAVGGRLVLIGLMSGRKADIDLGMVLAKRLSLVGSTLRGLPLSAKCEAVAALQRFAAVAFTEGRVRPIIDAVFPVADIQKAHQRMEANLNVGKIVLAWDA